MALRVLDKFREEKQKSNCNTNTDSPILPWRQSLLIDLSEGAHVGNPVCEGEVEEVSSVRVYSCGWTVSSFLGKREVIA